MAATMDNDYTPDIETEHYRQHLQSQITPVRAVCTATVSLPDRMAKESITMNYGISAWVMHHWIASSGHPNRYKVYHISQPAIYLLL